MEVHATGCPLVRLLTVARRSRPRCSVQSAPELVTRSSLCRRRWFDNLTSLCDHFAKVDVPLCSEKNSAKCAINIPGTAGALRLVPEDWWSTADAGSLRMQTLFDYQEDECPWYYFDGSYKTLLGACLILFGVFGVLLNGWLFATFIHSHLLIFKSHILVLNLCSASLGRNLLGFPFSGSSAIAKRWLFGSSCCQLFAFLNQFFGVFQMAALFSIVVERYLQARFYRREKSLYFRWYWTLVGVCWLSSVIFATPPLFGYGIYSCDSTGTSCMFSWPSLHAGTRQIGYSIPYIVLCGVIPVISIFYFMGKAIRLEKIYYRSEQQREQKRLTKSVHALTVATLALWIPAAVLIGWQWLPLLMYGYRPHVPPALSLIAPIAAEAATSIPVLCYLAADERLRAALLGRMRRHYALLHPEEAKRFKRDYSMKQRNTDSTYYAY